ncbi:hypothetical protein BgAZ_404960 [Babesia gibsoni]|uniref:PRELI/MSF1 domain-containing protein n=1 Tax=Babesia gibsoni TaxID=33632 RepID=A0AAD8LPE3_BABGI|nr:hypothetical protein BgAZ_404960 [Babesia gibsoni]
MMFTKSFYCNLDWESLSRGFYRMYPSKHYPYLRDVHIIDHQVLPATRQLKVRRIGRVRYDLPSIVHYIVGSRIEYMLLEESLLDLNTREISVKTVGCTMTDTYSYEEEAAFRCVGNGEVKYHSAINFRILGFGIFNSTLESVTCRVVSDFSKNNCVKMAMKDAVDKIKDD